MRARQVVKSWDIWVALVAAAIIFILLPSWVDINFAKDVYFAGLSVIAVVFSVFFASLAIIMSSSADEFVSFLEEKGQYTVLVRTFSYVLCLLFIALLLSIALYAFTSYFISVGYTLQTKWVFVLFCFMALYSLFAVMTSTRDTLTYSRYRTRFLEIMRRQGSSGRVQHGKTQTGVSLRRPGEDCGTKPESDR